jgi:hypothetical protein
MRWIAAPVCLFAAAAALHAQPEGEPDAGGRAGDPADAPPAEVTAPARSVTYALTLGGSYADTADLDSSDGELGITRARGAFEARIDLGERRSLGLGVGVERSWYDFDNATSLDASGDPFGEVTDTELSLRYSAPLNDRTTWFVLGSVGLAAEDGADLSESLVYTGAGGFTTQASDSLRWGVGVLVRSRIEDDVLVIPIPQIRWDISDRWTLESIRAGARLGYEHSDSLTYGLQAEYVSRSFRLDEDGPIPDGAATDRGVPASFFAEYKPTPAVTFVANLGASVYSNIELFDDDGNDLADDDLDPAVFLSFSARIAF